MIQATTPTITLTLPNDVDLTTATEVYVTFKQKLAEVTKTTLDGVTIDDDDENVVHVTLQEWETILFTEDYPVEVQVNWTQGSNRFATVTKSINVKKNLLLKTLVVI